MYMVEYYITSLDMYHVPVAFFVSWLYTECLCSLIGMPIWGYNPSTFHNAAMIVKYSYKKANNALWNCGYTKVYPRFLNAS